MADASPQEAEGQTARVVLLDYPDLQAGRDLTAKVAEAFGEEGLGICVVRGVPGLVEARTRLLPLARRLAKLPEAALARCEHEASSYCVGWSRGREKFRGKADTTKGSFYANPLFDDPADGDEEVRAKFPYAASRNVWPEELPELEEAFKELACAVYEAAKPLVAQCDRLVDSRHGAGAGRLFGTSFERSRMCLGRLLHYYALGPEDDAESWCGWHNDNSTITGLVPAMWLDDATGEEAVGVETTGGLHVQSRSGAVLKVSIPADCLGFQIGEAAQILSGGVLCATPHFVRGHCAPPGAPRLSRETFALFIEPQWDCPIGPPVGLDYKAVLRASESELIPPLSKRLKPDPETKQVEFGKLLGDSVQEYYNHNNAGT